MATVACSNSRSPLVLRLLDVPTSIGWVACADFEGGMTVYFSREDLVACAQALADLNAQEVK